MKNVNREILIIRTHIEELLTNNHAVERWLDSNEPVQAYKGIMKINEKIREILKEMDKYVDKAQTN